MFKRIQFTIAFIFAVMLAVTTVQAKSSQRSKVISNFNKKSIAQWHAPKSAKITPVKGWNDKTMSAKVNYGSKGGFSLRNKEGLLTIGKYNWLSFWIKSDGKPHVIYFYIREGKQDNKHWDQFYVKFTVEGSGWKPYIVDLTQKSPHGGKNHFNMAMRYAKSSKKYGGDKLLTAGEKVTSISFYASNGGTMSFSDLRGWVNKPSLGKTNIDDLIPDHSLIEPYTFRHMDDNQKITLTKNDHSNFQIVIPTKPTKTEKFAANELQKYLRKSTDARLKITQTDKKLDNDAFYISTKLKRWGLAKYRYTGKEKGGFKLATTSNDNIIITGGSEKGMLYGIYAFLEKAVGIRFFRPIAFGTVIPFHNVLTIPGFKDQEEPTFTYRMNSYTSNTRVVSNKRRFQIADWSVKNRYNVELGRLTSFRQPKYMDPSDFYAKRGGFAHRQISGWTGHNFQHLVSPKKYFKKHPHYFCYNASTGKWQAKRAQINVTNPEVHKIIAKQVKEYFRKYPDQKYVFIGQEDGSRLWSQDPKSLKLNPTGTASEQNMADQNIYLANHVAELIKKEFPNKIVATFAYSVTRRPPVNVKPDDNVIVEYTGFDINSANDVAQIKKWNKLLKKGFIAYTYIYADFSHQFVRDNEVKNNLRFLASHGAFGVRNENGEEWALNGYKQYIAPRLDWNPWLDVKALRKDYFHKLYGPAAKYMDKFERRCQHIFFDHGHRVSIGNSQYPIANGDDISYLRDLISKSYRSTNDGDDVLHARIGFMENALRLINHWSLAIKSVHTYDIHSNSGNMQQAQDELYKLKQFIKAHYKTEIVSYYSLRKVKSLQSHLKRTKKFVEIKNKYLKGAEKVIELPLKNWKFKLDPKDIGQKEKWFSKDLDSSNWSKINIGQWWDKQGYGTYTGYAWYRKYVTVPEKLNGYKKIQLKFLAVDEKAWVYIDGKPVGMHAQGDIGKLWVEPFSIDVSNIMKPGNTYQITVRMHNAAGAGGIWKPIYFSGNK